MKRLLGSCLIMLAAALAAGTVQAAPQQAAAPTSATQSADKPMRPPAVPLVACDPYFSIWSPADRLTDAPTVHWTGRPQRLTSMVRIDGKVFRLMGDEPRDVPALEQKQLFVAPTHTYYVFEGQGVRLRFSFMTPLLPEDLMILSRPVTYVAWVAIALDGKAHQVSVYYDNTAELVVNEPGQAVVWSQEKVEELSVMKVGTQAQQVLRRAGDRVRIDWGYACVAVPAAGRVRIAPAAVTRGEFLGLTGSRYTAGATPPVMPCPAGEAPVLSAVFDMGRVTGASATRHLILAYDDIYGMQFFGHNLKDYWRKDGAGIADLLRQSEADYIPLQQRTIAFDKELIDDLVKTGGKPYADLCVLAYRQSLAASKVVADAKGQPLFFPKENTSNGCVGTVDVFYPQGPLPLLVSPSLAKAMLVPILEYATSPRWKFPFAPHDLGTWPQANGQVYGEGERGERNQMPIEETGNMLLLVAAVAQAEGKADFIDAYWPLLSTWAGYLKSKGYDPENQLCTDDFAGHLAHNVNLSAKAICALGAYGKLCELKGRTEEAAAYGKLAREFALRWVKDADDGDHFRLAFDKPGTWSCKYNLVWDKILGLGLFPEAAIEKEMAFYRKHVTPYGLPLDGRKTWTKSDWACWTACLTGRAADFEAIIGPAYAFYNAATSRVGLADLYYTDRLDSAEMHSRPVIGGLFIRMLYDKAVWKKWAGRDQTRASGWAPLPTPPVVTTVVPTGEQAGAPWRYTTTQPARDWTQPGFNDAAWQEGPGGFGAGDAPGARPRTAWSSADIWLRRQITLPDTDLRNLALRIYHDEDAEVYLNGAAASTLAGYTTRYEVEPLTLESRMTLKPGANLIAVHCHQSTGGQFIDLGFVNVKSEE